MKQRVIVAVVGAAFVGLYAWLMAYQSLVLDPLAGVPGQTLPEIYAHLKHDGMAVGEDVASVNASAMLGALIAAAAAVFGVLYKVAPRWIVLTMLSLLALGGFVTFFNGFALEMDVADSYGIGGESHTIWAGVLYLTSLAAFVAALGIVVAGGVRTALKASRQRSQPS